MKLVTFNIRGDFGVDGANDFCFRKPLIRQKLAAEQPDIIGFQEVLPHVADWLREALPDWCVVGCGREKGLGGEQATIAFREDRFNLIAMQTFWLSPTPAQPGSRYEQQSWCPRTATELVLQERATGKVLRVVNTHLDHEGTLARQLGLKQILRHIDSADFFPNAPVVLMGDFNAQPDSEEMKIITAWPSYTSAAAEVGPTFHDFMRADPQVQIDYIYLKGDIAVVSACKWTEEQDGVCLSDHYPVCVEAALL